MTLLSEHKGLEIPISYELQYTRDLDRVLRGVQLIAIESLIPAINRSPLTRNDAINSDEIRRILRRLRIAAADVSARAIESVSKSFYQRVNNRNSQSLERLIGRVPPELSPREVEQFFVQRQVTLARSLTSEYVTQVSEVMQQAPVGIRASSLIDDIVKRANVARSRAKLIATNELLTLNSEINKRKQQRLGITRYQWSTSQDERVRSNHNPLNGREFSWTSPPVGGGTGPNDIGNPGDGINCRCIAVPVLA